MFNIKQGMGEMKADLLRESLMGAAKRLYIFKCSICQSETAGRVNTSNQAQVSVVRF